jgi:hypothetical protein
LRRLAIATGGLALLLAAPAHAATTIGSPNINATPDGVAGCEPGCPSALIQDSINGTKLSTPAGVIVKFRFKGDGPLAIAAYRPTERTDTHLAATQVGASAPVNGGGTSTVVEGTARIPVAEGDLVGLLVNSGASVYGIAEPAETTKAWGAAERGNALDSVNLQRGEFFYQAVIEPDADTDGFGDESQDKCLGKRGPSNGCPAPPAALKSATLRTKSFKAKAGKLAIALTNANGYAVSGTLSLKAGSKRAGSAKFTLGAGAKKSFSAKLSTTARRTLSRKHRLSLRLTITTRGPAGTRSATTRKTIVVTT